MKITKQIISIILLLTLLAGMVPTTVQAEEAQTTVENGGIAIEGTNSFGTLLSEDIQEQQEAESDYSGGYGVINLVVEDGIAIVEYDTLEEAFLVVSLYTEDGLQLLVSGKSVVQPEETETVITLEGELPEYFMASAYLLDTYDYSPLCASYDTPMYTREMQELLASTTDDYDADKVLNLDDDKTTNFAVYADTTKVLEYAEGVNTVISADDETATYVIENADEYITGLQVGDVLAYPYGEDQILIVKVATIAVDGTTATITGDELEMEEVFSYAKIEKTGNASDVTVDDSTLDEGVVFDGLTQEGVQTYSLRSTQGEGSIKNYLNYKLDKKIKSESDYTEASVTLKGSLGLELDIDISYYISMTRQFMKFETDVGLKLALSVSGKAEAAIPLGDLSVMFFGVSIGFEPEMQLQLQGKVEYSMMAGFTIGYIYDNYVGLLHLNTTPKVESDFKIEASIFIGIDMAPKIDILKGVIAEAKLKAPIGLELKAKLKGTLMGESATQGDRIHSCEKCIEMELNFKVEFSAKLEFLKCKWLTLETKVKAVEVKIGEYYWSLDNSEFGEGNCPYVKHRVSVQAKASNGQGVPDIDIIAIPKELQTEINLGKTNGGGVLTTYLQAGSYTLRAVVEGETLEKAVTVKEASKVIISSESISIEPDFISSESITDNGIVASGECGADGDNVTWTLYGSGLLRIQGSGEMQSHSYGSAPWYSYRASITSVEIGNGVTNIGARAFDGLRNVKDITIPHSVADIGDSALSSCSTLTSITIPDSVVCIGKNAFSNCSELNSATIGNGVKTIGENAFIHCNRLTDIHVTDINAWCGVSFANTYSQPLAINDNSCLYWCGEPVTDLVIPEGIANISAYAFFNYDGITSVIVPDGVLCIGYDAFAGCNNLSSAILPDSLLEISTGAFSSCNLTTITIPKNVTTIGTQAFYQCKSLRSITIPKSVTAIGSSAFYNTAWYSMQPNGIVYAGKVAYGYKGTYPTELVLDEGTRGIAAGAFSNKKVITSVSIPNGVTCIGSNAFASTGLTSITIPDSVTFIGDGAFSNCDGLISVTIPDSVISYESAFAWCANLQSVELSRFGTCIDYQAFHGCTSLSSIVIPNSVTTIAERAFGSSGLTSITIPDSVTIIDEWAFSFCDNLADMVFAGDAPMMSSNSFRDISIVAYYPAENETWTSDVMQGYGGTITWVPYNLDENGEIVPAETVEVSVSAEETVNLAVAETEETESIETETTITSKPVTRSIWGGEYTTEITDTYVLKTASFSGLVAGEEYVLLSVVSIETVDILAPDNMLYIDQAAAAEDGTLTFTYVQREASDLSYVIACGPSHNDIKDAVITFPEMAAGAETQTVEPTVVHDGNTLVEGVDYVIVGTVDYTVAGEYTCYIRGIYNYTGIVECTYTVNVEKPEITFGEKVYHNLRLQDLTKIGYAFTITTDETVDVYGVLIWTGDADTEVTVDTEGVQNKALAYDSGFYTTESDGIYAQRLDMFHYAKPYVKIGDQYVYGSVDTYSPLTYAQTILNGRDEKLKQLMIDLLNYGTYAQLYFAESNKEAAPEVLINDILTEEQKVMNWSDDLKVATPTVTKDTAKTLETKWYGTNLNLLEAIQMNMAATGNITGMYYWTEDAYNNAEVLNSESASGEAKIRIDGSYTIGGLTGIVAQSVSDVYYVCGYDESGNLGAIRADSVAAYATRLMESAASTEATVNMAKALLVYGNSAMNYFTQND